MKNSERIKVDRLRHLLIRAEAYRPYLCDVEKVGKRGPPFKVIFCVSGCRWPPDLTALTWETVWTILPSFRGFSVELFG